MQMSDAMDLASGLLDGREPGSLDLFSLARELGVRASQAPSAVDDVPRGMRVSPVATIVRAGDDVTLSVDLSFDLGERRLAVVKCLGRFLLPDGDENFMYEVFATSHEVRQDVKTFEDVMLAFDISTFAQHLLIPDDELDDFGSSDPRDVAHFFAVPVAFARLRLEQIGDR